ncbi:hypothetical protein GC197_05225 [bacterium]|nr:hypothetical protein [bacterium]
MTIRCFKHHGPLTRIERVCLSSFSAMHTDVRLLSYDKIENLPAGVQLVDANQILDSSSDLYRHNSKAGIEAIMRWKTLWLHGGCYVSTDMLCIRPFDFHQQVVLGRKSEFDGYRWGLEILIFPPENSACRFMLNRCLQPHFPIAGEKLSHRLKKAFRRRFSRNMSPIRSWNIGGERGFQHAVEQFGLERYAQPIPVFYPVHEARWRSPFDDTFREDWQMLPSTRAVFLNCELVGRNKFDLNAPFQPGSLMHYYEQKFLGDSLEIAA